MVFKKKAQYNQRVGVANWRHQPHAPPASTILNGYNCILSNRRRPRVSAPSGCPSEAALHGSSSWYRRQLCQSYAVFKFGENHAGLVCVAYSGERLRKQPSHSIECH